MCVGLRGTKNSELELSEVVVKQDELSSEEYAPG